MFISLKVTREMSSLSILLTLQDFFTRYRMSIYVACGNVGNLILISMFSQRDQRRNSCSLYLLGMSLCNLLCLDIGIIPLIFALDHSDITVESLFACRFQFYLRHSSFQLMRTFKVLACFDRYALSTENPFLRSFAQPRVAHRSLLCVTFFWLLLVIFFSVIRSIENGSCGISNRIYSLIYTIYYLIFAGLLPPVLILLLTFLVLHQLKKVRQRVQPRSSNRRRDRDLLRMVFIEVTVYVINTTPFSLFLVYRLISDQTKKSRDRQQLESFVNYLSQSFLMYFNTALPFYIYLFSSSSFRKQFQRWISMVKDTLIRRPLNRINEEFTQTIG